MHADDILRPLGDGGDFVDVEVGGVAGEDRAGLGQPVEPREDLLLHVHILVHRLDDEVAVAQRVEVERGSEGAHRRFDLFGLHPALGGGRLVILADHAGAAIERLLRHFDDRHGNAGAQEVHRNAATHRAGADHADAFDRALDGIGGDVVDLGRLAFGEEDVALRGGLVAHHQLHEFLPFEGDAVRERRLGRLHDAGNVGGGRVEAAEAAAVGLLERGNRIRVGLYGPLRRTRDRPLRLYLVRKGDRIRLQAVLTDDLVDQAGLLRLLGADRIALRGHLQRQRDPGNARQPLRAACTGQQAELHFGRAELRRGDRDAIMTAQRHLAPATQRRAVDRRDDRLGRCLDHVDHGGQARLDHRFAELGDVGAGEEGTAIAADHHRRDRSIGDAFLDRGLQPLPHGCAQRIDRRVVGDDDEYVVVAFGADRRSHRVSPS